MKLIKSKKGMALLAVLAIAVLSAVGAYAYWTNSGTGTGTAATGTNAAITVNQTSTITGLYPGGPAQTLSGNFDNGNAGKVYVASVSATVTGTDKAGCDATDYAIAGSAPVNAEVPAGSAQGSWSGLTIAMVDKAAANQDACKGATVSISYTSN